MNRHNQSRNSNRQVAVQAHVSTHLHKSGIFLKLFYFGIFIALLSANIITFARTVGISDEIVKLETETLALKKENSQLEQKLYTQNSITNLEALADQMGFTKASEPLFLESSEYALVP